MIKKTGDAGSGMGVKNRSNLVLKEIYGICETKNFTKDQISKKKKNDRMRNLWKLW